jgi:hypothetical protein
MRVFDLHQLALSIAGIAVSGSRGESDKPRAVVHLHAWSCHFLTPADEQKTRVSATTKMVVEENLGVEGGLGGCNHFVLF